MFLENLPQVLFYGIYSGAIYGLAALGIALIFGIMDMLNVAQGTLIMLGAYLCFWLFKLFHIDPFLSIPLVLAAFFLVGIVIYRLFFFSMIKLSVDEKIKNSMLVAFGLALLFENLVILVWTPDQRAITPSYEGAVFKVLGLRFAYTGIGSILLAILLIFALHFFMKRTYLGRAIRATTQNWQSAMLMGVNIHFTYALSMAIGTGLAAVAGILILLNRGVTPTIGMEWTIKGLIITVLSGTGNIGGIFVSGLFFGILETVASLFTGAYNELVGLILFVGILIFRPQGLFGKG